LPIHRFIPLLSGLVLFGMFAHDAAAKEPAVTFWPRFSSSKTCLPRYEQIQKEAKKYLGVPYRRGGSNKKGMDCSGFVRRIYGTVFDVDLPHNASQQYSSPMFHKVPTETLKTGDLIFFSSTKRTRRITHVGIYLSDGLFIHAAQQDGVRISRLDNPYWNPKIVASKRLISNGTSLSTETFQSMAGLVYSPDETSSFRLHYSAMEHGPPHRPQEPPVWADIRLDRSHAFEVEYMRTLWDDLGTLRLTAFRADLPADAAFTEQRLFQLGPHSRLTDEHSDSEYFQGIKMEGHIKPFQWLRITPSFAYFNYGPDVDDHDLPRRSLGLELQLGSLKTGWSLSTAFLYHDQNPLTTRIFDLNGDWNALDMSFTFRHQLTEHVQFSLMGQSISKAIPDLEASLKTERQAEQSLFFALDFTY